LLEERACVPTGQDFLFHSPKNAPGSALSFVLSGPQDINIILCHGSIPPLAFDDLIEELRWLFMIESSWLM
jgi:hypothetical protein